MNLFFFKNSTNIVVRDTFKKFLHGTGKLEKKSTSSNTKKKYCNYFFLVFLSVEN